MMALRDKLVIELCTENLQGTDYHYANLKLPATEGQIEDAMQIARAIGREEYIQISVDKTSINDVIIRKNRPTIHRT